jgi:hypothetical protein
MEHKGTNKVKLSVIPGCQYFYLISTTYLNIRDFLWFIRTCLYRKAFFLNMNSSINQKLSDPL